MARRQDLKIASGDEIAAAFWNRPPEQIHRDLNPTDHQILDRLVRSELVGHRIRQHCEARQAQIPAEDRAWVALLTEDLVEQWIHGPPSERTFLVDLALQRELLLVGPRVLAEPGAQEHLGSLWQAMQTGPRDERRVARERWRRIWSAAEPNLRRMKDRVDPGAVADAVKEAEKRLAPLRRRWHSRANLSVRLQDTFPAWTKAHMRMLFDALWLRDRVAARRALHAAVGLAFGLEAGSVPEILAAGRKQQRIKARIEAGRRRYADWLRART